MIEESELPINADGSVFHLHLRPEQIADKIILVGDQDRVTMVAKYFDTIECEVQSREFHTITGTYKGKRISCVSTGIGCDNIDIVMTELDALVNIDLDKREVKQEHKTLELVRLGTCGGLQPFTPIGSFIASVKSIGFDGLLNYYVAVADKGLIERIAADDMVKGITCACGGFYGPQGREVRLAIQDPDQNEKIEAFEYDGLRIGNFEMESSALAGLASLLGHKAMTCCIVVANRYNKEMNTEYRSSITDLIELVLERI